MFIVQRGFLHHSECKSVTTHGICFDWDPQVFTVLAALFLLLFGLHICDRGLAFAATTQTSIGMTTAATMTAHQHRCEEHNQRQSQKHYQANRVVDALVMLGWSEAPHIIEKLLDCLLHGSARVLQIPVEIKSNVI